MCGGEGKRQWNDCELSLMRYNMKEHCTIRVSKRREKNMSETEKTMVGMGVTKNESMMYGVCDILCATRLKTSENGHDDKAWVEVERVEEQNARMNEWSGE